MDLAANPRAFVDYLAASSSMAYHLRVKEEIEALLELGPGQRVLDVGCGVGDTVARLSRLTGPRGRAVGVDSSVHMVEEARQRAQGQAGLEYRVGDAYGLDFPDGAFDACYAEKVFVHLREPHRVLAEMARVTRPGGRVLVFEMDAETMVVSARDRTVTRRILQQLVDRFGNGWAGRGLYGQMKEVGLTALQVVPQTLVLTDFQRADAYWKFSAIAQRTVETGAITSRQAREWVRSLQDADREGHFFNALTAFLVCGEKP